MKKNFRFIFLCLFTGAAVAALSFFKRESVSSNVPDAVEQARKKQELVNKYLNSAVSNREQNRNKIENEIDRTPAIGEPQRPLVSPNDNRFIRQSPQVEANSRGSSYTRPESPAEVIQMEMYKQKMQEQADEAYRQEYARQFKENALRNGYEIELDQNLEVISVKPLRQPSSSQPSDYDYE